MTDEIFIPNLRKESLVTRVKKQFAKNRLALFAFRMICLLLIIALSADFVANEKPLIASYRGTVYFPVFKSFAVAAGIERWPEEFRNIVWKNLNYDFAVFPPIPYSPGNMDEKNARSVGPFEKQDVQSFRWRHFFGTDELGRDVLSGMIHGTRIALMAGFISMGIASLIGIFLGAMAGYFGDDKLKVSRGSLWMFLLFLFPAFFYSFFLRRHKLIESLSESFFHFAGQALISVVIFSLILFIGKWMAIPLRRIHFFRKKIDVPVDILVMRLIEIIVSVPSFFLIISFVAVAKPSLYLVLAIIGFTTWTGIAKYIRAEMLRVRQLNYIETANALGFSSARVLLRHALPNSLSPVLVAVAFGVANAILIESGLSFLGIGVPPETMTWGSLLASARITPSAWWLALFPGFAIFATVTLCNLMGEGLSEALDPRLKK